MHCACFLREQVACGELNSVLENVELALLRLDDKKERRRRAKELIARVGLTEQMNRRGSKLSGGEKQRTVIARALAKDAPVILADEPTGNLDVKASKEVAALLKEVSRDKLVIVVTHNPEFFKQYATRRVRIYDGSVSEDKQIEPPAPLSQTVCEVLPPVNRFHNFRNTLHIGVLNYKSRPKFTTMMSLALAVCAVTLFLVIALFGQSLISPLTTTLDGVGIEGKVIEACLYFPSDEAARAAIANLPEGYMGLLSTSNIYVQNPGDIFTTNVLWYVALIAVSLLIGVLIGIIFMRSVKIYQADFAVYRTLGIPNKVSSRSLYIQMALIFLPALVLLPLVSLIATIIPGSSLTFISVGNYFFIEIMLICPDYAEELRCIVQEWGVTGEDKQGILLDDGNTYIVYDGAEYIPVACGKTSVDLRSVAVLKKMCSPAQQFVFVQDFVKRENGEYCRDIIEETVDFLDAAELFEGLTGRRIEEATPTNCVIQGKGEAEM